MRRWLLFFSMLLLAACANPVEVEPCLNEIADNGFWNGLLHGVILPFSFIGSLFSDDIAIYAVNNNGGWYNFGFVLGASIIFGGSGRGSKR